MSWSEEEEEWTGSEEEEEEDDEYTTSKQEVADSAHGYREEEQEAFEEFDDGYLSDLMGDEEDRRRISMMTELERETALYDRAKRRERLLDAYEAKRENAMIRRRQKLSEMKSDKEKRKDALESLNLMRKRKRTTSSLSAGTSIRSEVELKKRAPDMSQEQQRVRFEVQKDVKEIPFSKLRALILRKTKIEEWITKPFFEKMKGLYVRIPLGKASKDSPMKGQTIYSIGEIEDVVESSNTYILNNNTVTKRVLIIRHLKGKRKLAVKYISNRSVEEKEYYKWINAMRRSELEPPTEDEFEAKLANFKYMNEYTFSQDEVDQLVEDNRRYGIVSNAALERKRIQGLLEQAEERNDFEAYERYSKEFKKLDRIQSRQKSGSGDLSLAASINEKNKARSIERQLRIEAQSRIKGQKNELDPFQRRHTSQQTVVFTRNDKAPAAKNTEDVVENENGDDNEQKKEEEKETLKEKAGEEEAETAREAKTILLEDIYSINTAGEANDTKILSELIHTQRRPVPVGKARGTPIPSAGSPVKKKLNLSEYRKRRMTIG